MTPTMDTSRPSPTSRPSRPCRTSRSWCWRSATTVVALALGVAGCTTAASGDAVASPAAITFPDTTVGVAVTRDLVVTNQAPSGALTVDAVSMSGPARGDFTDDFDDAGAAVLEPGESLTLAVTFTPSATGDRAATLNVTHSGPSPLAVALSGTGVAAPTGDQPLLATPAAVDYGQVVVGGQSVVRVVLANGGDADITIGSAVVTGPSAAMFPAAEPPQVVRAGRSVRLAVTFAPTASGSHDASLVIAHSGTNTPLIVPLTGTAVLADGSGVVVHRLNAGGPPLPGAPLWAEDSAVAPSPTLVPTTSGNTAAWSPPIDLSHPSVPAGTPAELFLSERDGPAAGPPLGYSLAVPAGVPLELRLYLAEMYPPAGVPGGRVFDVLVDGLVVRDDVDVAAEVGPAAA
ncbi:MAG TPA: choice-of-anchor D domain-containing protein, partial [Acidimicrobiales bacterium]|nr:choice-of-anchor D domain-containing protein [Acidimicrobiales bacterium]